MVLWGIVLMCHAIPNTFAPFFVLRVILGKVLHEFIVDIKLDTLVGMLESCVAPLLILIISMFYKKNEQVSFAIGVTYSFLIFIPVQTNIVVLCDGVLCPLIH